MNSRADDSPRIVIVGGGFAGATLARALERTLPAADILLLSDDNYITFHPLLPEVVGASIMPGHAVAPLRQMVRKSRVRMVCVDSIDLDNKTVHYQGEGPCAFSYEHLVLACGSKAKLDLVPGMAEHALPLKTLGDALHLRNRIIERLEHADHAYRRWLTTFIVGGGGFSGVEVAGEISDFLAAAHRYYPHLPERPRVILIHGRDRLLPEMPAILGNYTARALAKRGVELHLSTRTESVDGRGIALKGGARLEGGTLISTMGVQPNPLIETLSAEKDKGRLRTLPDMSLPGRPGVWALGDCASVVNAANDTPSPPTAQFAIAQASQLAANIVRAHRGQPTRAFAFRPRGLMSAVGHNQAVALIHGLPLSGFVPWLLWRGYYLLKMPTFARKARIYLEWNWAMFFPPDTVHLRFSRTRASTQTIDEQE
jgi:NADH dehydrogenase